MIRTSARGNQFQSIFCKAKQNGDYTNYIGYVTIGNKVYKVCPDGDVKQDRRGNDGIWVTLVATSFTPNRNRQGGRF